MSDKIIVTGHHLTKVTERFDPATMTGVVEYEGGVTASDGYHTFEELYDHRIELFIALCRKIVEYGAAPQYREKIWRSKLHSDGSSFEGWFIMGITTYDPLGSGQNPKQMTYHLPMYRWEDTDFAETLDRAPEWDGHTPADVIQRLKNL